ncbi:MAG: bifunctional acetate--CoA ligase family protein/GNAT family N-acetyltransferase [Sulfuritalea sp.]|nr:bifunctional acetate--CoA ligase family protein/GNAT family N-acetyltransferase [Sulfuritalea sp.]
MALDRTPLHPFVAPAGIALFGASPTKGTLGFGLAKNISQGSFSERCYFINPKHTEIEGRPCHPSLNEIDARISLALIASPADSVPSILEACGKRNIQSAIVYSAGFNDSDVNRCDSFQRMAEMAARKRIRIFGPKALGYALPHSGLNATPITKTVPTGNLAFVSQSSAICAGILDWSMNNEFGFSAIFCPGEGTDLELPEILDYLAADPHTESILLYLEGLHDARRFLSSARAAASVKPVIAVKAGNHPMSARIAETHSKTRVDRDDTFDAALRRAGVLRVRSIGDMFSAARALTTPRMPKGNRLAIISNGGGPAVMATDTAAELGIALGSLTPHTLELLNERLPTAWSKGNPVDVLFDANPERFVGALMTCIDDPNIDGVLAILSPNTFVSPTDLAHAVLATTRQITKPLLTCWMGEAEAREGRATFAKARIPTFRTPENAVVAFAFMVNWVRNQKLLQETPPSLTSYQEPNTQSAQALVMKALAENRHILTLPEAKEVLAAFHIPVSTTTVARSSMEAVEIADQLGYPVTMKLATSGRGNNPLGAGERQFPTSALEVETSFDSLTKANDAREVYLEPFIDMPSGRELRISIRPDRVFGPVLALSEGGIAPDIYDARSIALPPLNPRLVGEMIEEPHVARLLGPLRQMPAVAEAPLRDILLRVSEIASELPWLRALDIGSLLADENGAVVTDVRIDIRSLSTNRDRYEHMAIYPYPAQFAGEWALKNKAACTIRPIRPEDANALQEFVRGLSHRSKYFRYFSSVSELTQHLLARYTQIDYSRELTLVATVRHDGRTRMVGEANYAALPDRKTCEFAIIVADEMAGQGLGFRLMSCLMEAARQQGYTQIYGQVLPDNEPMLTLMESLDFVVRLTDEENGALEVSRDL